MSKCSIRWFANFDWLTIVKPGVYTPNLDLRRGTAHTNTHHFTLLFKVYGHANKANCCSCYLLKGYYMYIEASSPRQLRDFMNAKLYSPPLKFLGNACLKFYYHMSGVTIGSLRVTINGKLVFYESGNKGDIWKKATIDASSILGLHRVSVIFASLAFKP